MTVKELIEKLTSFPSNYQVAMAEFDISYPKPIGTVRQVVLEPAWKIMEDVYMVGDNENNEEIVVLL